MHKAPGLYQLGSAKTSPEKHRRAHGPELKSGMRVQLEASQSARVLLNQTSVTRLHV